MGESVGQIRSLAEGLLGQEPLNRQVGPCSSGRPDVRGLLI